MMGNAILEVELEENDAEANTVGDYLKELLVKLLDEEESFSGKRPFGNSGWLYEIAVPLVKRGLVKGTVNAEGEVEQVEWWSFQEEMQVAIHNMWKPE